MKKKYFILVLLVIICLILSIFIFSINNKPKSNPIDKSKYTQIYFYDLGKSNIEIIIKDDFIILINTGLEEERDNLLDYLDQLGIEEIDYLILTNRDDKYIGNASFIVESFKVDYLYLNDYEYKSDKVNSLLEVLVDSYTEEIVLTSNENIMIDSLKIDIYPYMENEFKMEDKTFIINIKEGDNSIYLTNNVSSKRLDFSKSDLVVSENKDIFDIKAKYYIYDGEDKVKDKTNLLKRNKSIYMNEKELILK